MTSEMELVVDAGGGVRCIYDEALDLREIGKLQITRASHVEPDAEGYWWADMGPVGGPVLGPFRNRTGALEAERQHLHLRIGQRGNARETHLALVSVPRVGLSVRRRLQAIEAHAVLVLRRGLRRLVRLGRGADSSPDSAGVPGPMPFVCDQ